LKINKARDRKENRNKEAKKEYENIGRIKIM
jgi:hypothetical protein